MHVFVTGGTGTIGSAVVADLLAHDHTVLGLARSETSAASLRAAGAEVVRGSLTDLDVLRTAADGADGVVSLAFDHASAQGLDSSIAAETAAMSAMAEALVGSDKAIAVVSGTPWIAGRLSTEADPLPTEGPVGGRSRAVGSVLRLSERGVRASAVRMPRTVHDQGRGGFAGLLVDAARRSGVAGYPGDGSQRWPAVHARDAASLFRIALESAPAGTAWHAVADEGDRVRDLVEVIGRRLGLPVRAVGDDTFGAFGPIFALDQPSSSAYTQDALGWKPVHASLLDDLEHLDP